MKTKGKNPKPAPRQPVAEIQRTLAANMKSRRKALDLTQASLGVASEMTTTAIARIEGCDRWPRPDNLENIAKALDTTVSGLLEAGVTAKARPSRLEALEVISDLVRGRVVNDPIPEDIRQALVNSSPNALDAIRTIMGGFGLLEKHGRSDVEK